MVLLTVLWVKTCQDAYGSHEHYQLGSGAAFWHMVDLLWIVLFPLAYVMRRKVQPFSTRPSIKSGSLCGPRA